MYRYLYHFLPVVVIMTLAMGIVSCSDDETYAEQKERERDAIQSFLKQGVDVVNADGDTTLHVGRINLISEEQFLRQDSTTDVAQNEYVLFGNTGVYMQIVRRGVGSKLESGKTKQVVARYIEFNIMADSILTTNLIPFYNSTPDLIDISNSYGTFTASFNITENGGGAMYRTYSSTEVPAGWLIPFSYIHLGRQINKGDEISKVRLIVPHTKGTSRARQYVYPCFYEIEFQYTYASSLAD